MQGNCERGPFPLRESPAGCIRVNSIYTSDSDSDSQLSSLVSGFWFREEL
jgi:hypothetical protein